MRAGGEGEYLRNLRGTGESRSDELSPASRRRCVGQDPRLRGPGRFTDDPLETFGGAGVVEIPRLQKLLRHICENGFEHHVAANLSTSAAAVYEAAKNYLGWDVYWHQ